MWSELLRDFEFLRFWASALLPILGAVSLAQIWKLSVRDRKHIKPPNWQVQLVATGICVALSTMVYGFMGRVGWNGALAYGLMIGPAAPLLWWMAKNLVPDRVARAMRGERRHKPRRDPMNDTLYGDDTSRDEQVRRWREERAAARRRRG